MPPTASTGELWGYYSMPNEIDVDCLLPDGVLITLKCNRESTLNDVRRTLWEEARSYPMNKTLKSTDSYIFTSISQEAEEVEFYDYTKPLCDLKLFHPFFRLVDAPENIEQRTFEFDLNKAVGIYPSEFDQIRDPELVQYRTELHEIIRNMTTEKLKQREDEAERALLECIHAPYLEIDPSLLDFSVANAVNSINLWTLEGQGSLKLTVDVHVSETDAPTRTYTLAVPLNHSPLNMVSEIIRQKLSGANRSQKQINDTVENYKDAYMLNVCGCDEVFYGAKSKVAAYKYIQKCISSGQRPHFYLVTTKKIKSKLPKNNPNRSLAILKYLDEKIKHNQSVLSKLLQNSPTSGAILSWNVSDPLTIYLDSISNLPSLKDTEKLFFRISVYHGQELVTKPIESNMIDPERISRDRLGLSQIIKLDLKIRNIHRCAKICFSLYSISRKKREFFSIGYLNLNLFDYRGCLINGKKSMSMWPVLQNSLIGTSVSDVAGQNPKKDFVRFDFEFSNGGESTMRPIVYPNRSQINTFIRQTSDTSQDDCLDVQYALENDNELLNSILSKDALAELTEQDKSVLWRRRGDCLTRPNSLPKLLQAVKWNCKDDVIEIYNLLYQWPEIKPIVAMELLHSVHTDIEVRNFAVKCLDAKMKDEEVQQYLLQLVQTLKNEPYYDNQLSRFLLRRAFTSQRIGFDLYWHLKSEIKSTKHKFRFGLMLEAFCAGIGPQLKDLIKQVELVEKLSVLAQTIKNTPNNITLIKSSYLHDVLSKSDYQETLSNFTSPLNRSHIFGRIDASHCRILSSAKRPLYLRWTNACEYSEYYGKSFDLIFKHGDDLRQDMLTIQILRLMDIIWKNEAMDFKMLIYDCYSTGSKTGFIEVIKDALTLFKIQRDGGFKDQYQINPTRLLKWISDNNPGEKLDTAIDAFTRSCAGYCVATFILGIGDRHPDNIMVNKEGKLFHIDFGHFLGHFKKKYGIKRERVAFVFTEDFAKVITRGAMVPAETMEFQKFRKLCEDAYIIIRRYSHLIINLVMLMLPSDMPELQSVEDIMYLRKTLAIDETEERAREFFRNQFDESYRLSFTTKVDWVFHALNKKNNI